MMLRQKIKINFQYLIFRLLVLQPTSQSAHKQKAKHINIFSSHM